MLAFVVACSLLRAGPDDGGAAIARCRAVIRALGVKGELRLQGLWSTSQGSWTIRLSNPRLTYESAVDSGGRVRYVTLTEGQASLPAAKDVNIESLQVKRTLDTFLRAVNEQRAVGKPFKQLHQRGVVSAWYPLLVNGYRFFSSGASDRYSFEGHGGTLIECSVAGDPPPVNAAKPKISQAQAAVLLKGILERNRKAAEDQGSGSVSYSGAPSFVLGYYLFDGEKVARLVWRVGISATLVNGIGSRSWGGTFLIDALSGEEMKFSVMPGP